MSCLVEIPRLVSWKLLFPQQTLAFYMRNIDVSTLIEMKLILSGTVPYLTL